MIIRSPFVSGKKALAEMQHSALNTFLGALFGRGRKDYSHQLEDVTGSSLIMSVLLWIVRRWPEAPMYLEKVGAKPGAKGDAIYDHPMLTLLGRPNSFYSGAELWFGAILSLVWDGNGYIVKVRNKRDLSIRELWYVPHFQMEPKVNQGSANFVDYYEYSPGGITPIKLEPSDVIHLRYGIDPFNPRKGLSPLRSVARDAATDEEADNFAASMLHNMGVPGLVISPDLMAGQVVEIGDIDATKRYFEQAVTGDRRGKPVVMKGPTKIQQFGFDPKSMDIASLRGIPEERISAVTGVPAAVVGFGSGLAQTKVGATMKELREMAYEDAEIPLQRLVGPQLETQLLDDFEPQPEKFKVCFDLSKVRVLQDDQDALYTRTINAFNGGLISREQGKQALGFDTTDADKIRRVPFSVTEVPDGMTLDEIDALNPSPWPDPLAANNNDPNDDEQKGRKGRKSARRAKAFIAAQAKAEARLHAAYVPDLADGFKAIADRVVAAYESTKGRAPQGRKDEGGEEIDPNSPEGLALAAEAQRVKAAADAAGPLSAELQWQPHYLAATKMTVANLEAVFGISLDLPDVAQREIIAKGGRHIALVNIDKQVQDAIYKALSAARTEGLGPREVARLIRADVEGAAMYPGVYQDAYDRAIARGWSDEKAMAAGDRAARQYRAEVISRTETKYAQNVSTLEAAKSSGTFDTMLAFDSQKGSFDDECDARNGQYFSFEEAEAETAKEHPNGTLSWSPAIRGGA